MPASAHTVCSCLWHSVTTRRTKYLSSCAGNCEYKRQGYLKVCRCTQSCMLNVFWQLGGCDVFFLAWCRCSELMEGHTKKKNTKPQWVIMFFPVVKCLYTNGSGILEDENASIRMNAQWVIGRVWKWSGPSTEAAVYGSQCYGKLM